MDAVETIERDGFTARIVQDVDPWNPRKEQDNLGVMVHWHRHYDLGDREADETELDALRRGGWPLLVRYLELTEHAVCVLPLSFLDHSGYHIWVGSGEHWSDPGGWDSGTVGFIYATRERVAELGVPVESTRDVKVPLGVGTVTHTVPEVEAQLRAEVEEYDQYLTGDVYEVIVEDPDGKTIEGCGGFFGFKYAKQEAEEMLDAAIRDWVAEHAGLGCVALLEAV